MFDYNLVGEQISCKMFIYDCSWQMVCKLIKLILDVCFIVEVFDIML